MTGISRHRGTGDCSTGDRTIGERTIGDRATGEHGVALLAVLFALTLLMLLALPFGVSMSAGADAAAREVDAARAEQASASARDLLLANAALSHPMFDETRDHDSLLEWPGAIVLPEAMTDLADDGRIALGGEVEDLQRYIALDSVSPLVLANLLGTAVRLGEELAPDAKTIVVDRAEALPETGYLWIAHEIVRYGGKDGNRLVDVERGLFGDQGFVRPEDPYAEGLLALDYRCVLAAAWPFMGRSPGVTQRMPYAAVTELAEISGAGIGTFTQDEIDRFTAALCVEAMAGTAATWGRPERVFDELVPGSSPVLRVKSALHIGAGSTVRLKDLATGTIEYGLVMRSHNERAPIDLLLPSVFRLELLTPVLRAFPGGDTVIEPLIPPPVNLNTASAEVLTALFEDVRREAGVRVHVGDRQQTAPPRAFARAEAQELADAILAERHEGPGATGLGAFTGWQDLVERVFKPRLDAAGGNEGKMRWIYLYRNLQTGRDAVIEMGTAPIGFDSGPWVRYRAAASSKRSRVSPAVAARHERVGVAAAVPGFQLEHDWRTQQQLEEAFRLDRRSPFWVTTPINLGASQPGDLGNDPAGRYFPHLIAQAFPELGFGQARFPSRDDVDAGVQPAPATTPFGDWLRAQRRHESFGTALSPRGWEIARDGPYLMKNVGPPDRGSPAAGGGGRHDQITFPFSGQFGFMQPVASQFWLEPQSLDGVTVWDHSDGDPDRNRLALLGRDGNLVLELIDEAGLDPNASDSPAGVDRTALQVTVPLPEIGLPADTPVHLALSAHSGRPSEVTLQLDGMPRGTTKFVTYLTAGIDAFDPSQPNNAGLPPQLGNQRYFDIQVEDTEGFPDVGTLRIGTELFEYTGKSGGTFQCQWRDSIGGRGARQVAREHAPSIPVDSEGKPTIDINQLNQQGINLDVFPAHPPGAKVELYGYSTLLSPDSPMMPGETALGAAVGGFAVARGFLSSGLRPITLQVQGRPPINIGEGIDENWTGDLELADPVAPPAPDTTYPPDDGQTSVLDAFPTTGGYALLLQRRIRFTSNIQGTISVSEACGGIEVVKYASRRGSKLSNVQRQQRVPGNDAQINSDIYDGTARKFVMDWENWPWDPNVQQVYWDNIPTLILWVIPITLPVANTRALWDPQDTQLTEWLQILPRGDQNDTEWVRYDAILDSQHVARINRAAWNRTYFQLIRQNGVGQVQVGPLGPNTALPGADTPPWGQVQQTSNYIGYVPRLEADFPQIYRVRQSLGFRGDMMLDFYQEGLNRTSSHAHSNSVVTQCQRLALEWGNYGAFTGRPGRHDRVALIAGSTASGTQRPVVEWHTVNWAARRFDSDNLSSNNTPTEFLGPWPFQLVAFRDGVRGQFIGPPTGTQGYPDPRSFDRMVKFPSGELPSAFCENVHVGAGVGNESPATGFVDEVQVVQHENAVRPLVVEQEFNAAARTFRVHLNATYDPTGLSWWTNNWTDAWPQQGGLIQIDGEIIAYQQLQDGEFTVAVNGRGMLGTEARDHDRGAHVTLLTHRPMAILSGQITGRDSVFPVAARGALPVAGTLRLGRELLHYTWTRVQGDSVQLEMPRWYPPDQIGTSSMARGLFRARFGTEASVGSSGEAVVFWPFRYWDRHAELSDDPELGYSQFTTTAAPSFFRALSWREEVKDSNVDVICQVRTDSRAPWTADPSVTAGLWEFTRAGDDDAPRLLSAQGARLEVRFSTLYKSGAIDLVTSRAHGWKTSAKISRVRIEYEGEPRIFDERVTTR